MLGQELIRYVSSPTSSKARSSDLEATVLSPMVYRRPNLEFVGPVTQLVQSGPTGNRYETYRCSYWSDR